MKIWVDADACPVVIKDILYRAANRAQIPLTLVANQMLRVPPSPWIKAVQVPGGFDVADQRIAGEAQAGDLVVTADIPLASQVIAKGAIVIDPRGELLDMSNIEARLTMRNFMESLPQRRRNRRPAGAFAKRPPGFCQSARSNAGKTVIASGPHPKGATWVARQNNASNVSVSMRRDGTHFFRRVHAPAREAQTLRKQAGVTPHHSLGCFRNFDAIAPHAFAR